MPGGSITASEALEAEMDDADLIHLPRLVIDFNRRYFGRLRNLIDAINVSNLAPIVSCSS